MNRRLVTLIIAAVVAPILRLLDAAGPIFSNNLAAVIVKPVLPGEKFAWLEEDATGWRPRPAWFQEKFGSPPAP
jgi:hypothetical protein